MNTKDIIDLASVHLQELPGEVLDLLTVSKPESIQAALNLTKIGSDHIEQFKVTVILNIHEVETSSTAELVSRRREFILSLSHIFICIFGLCLIQLKLVSYLVSLKLTVIFHLLFFTIVIKYAFFTGWSVDV